MCLSIYTKKSEIPKELQLIKFNDLFFNGVSIPQTALAKNILWVIDHAKYNSPETFIGRDESLGALNKSMLSTGCKTLLNIITHPDICFDLIECGENALEMLPLITNGKVYWKNPVAFPSNDTACDICIQDKHFSSYMDALGFLMEE